MPSEDPNQRGKRDPTDMEAVKKQGKQMAKMGKRGQERKPIDDFQFPTLDVELIEPNKYPRILYFPYMPRRLRDWPMFPRIPVDDMVFAVAYWCAKWGIPFKMFTPKFWRGDDSQGARRRIRRVVWSIPSIPARLGQIRAATRDMLALPPPTASRSDPTSRPAPIVPAISAPQTASVPSVTNGTQDSSIALVEETPTALAEAPQAQSIPSVFSKKYWRAVLIVLRKRNPPWNWVRKVSMSFKLGYHRARAFAQKYRPWRYLDPGYWGPAQRKEAVEQMRQLPVDALRGLTRYMQESEKYGKEARDYYEKMLDNDRRNWNAMGLVASKHRFPDYHFPFFGGLATRTPVDWSKWVESRPQRVWENEHFKDLSSPKSPLSSILKQAKATYVEMNRAVAEGRHGDLRQYASKRYLNELEKRAVTVSRNGKSMIQKWRFERWGTEPECISIRAKDFFSNYPGAQEHGGDHLVINMLVKFDSWQSLEIRGRATHGNDRRQMTRKHEAKRVVEYLVLDFRTWLWRGKPKFIQQVYPGQKLDVVTHEMSEEKMMEAMRKRSLEEEEEEGPADEKERGGKVALPHS